MTKYFLCAEHFTDECFLDPPFNTRLKKTHHPLSIPIPTVFKSNFLNHVPNIVKSPKERRKTLRKSNVSRGSHRAASIGTVSLLNKDAISRMQRREETVETNTVVEDGSYMVTADPTDVIPNNWSVDEYSLIVDETNADDTDPLTETIITDSEPLFVGLLDMTCRLCANCIDSTNDLTNIFENDNLFKKVSQVMPEPVCIIE